MNRAIGLSRASCSTLGFAVCLLVTFHAELSGQQTDHLAGVKDLILTSELAVVWSDAVGGSWTSNQKVYNLGSPFLLPGPKRRETGTMGIGGNRHVDVAAGNFNGDRYDDPVAVWEGPNNRVNLLVPQINPQTLTWDSTSAWRSTINVPLASFNTSPHVRVKTGDFDGDRLDEFVVAFHGSDRRIHLQVYDTDSSLVPQPRAAISDERLSTISSQLTVFDIATSDLDGDGNDEIILAAFDSAGVTPGRWGLYVKIYDVTGAGSTTLVPKATKEFYSQQYTVGSIAISVRCGNFNVDPKFKEIAVGFSFQQSSSAPNIYLDILRASANLDTLFFNPSNQATAQYDPSNSYRTALAVGDLNLNGRDEIILGFGDRFYLYAVDSTLTPQLKRTQFLNFQGSSNYTATHNFIAVEDMDRDSKDEIAVCTSLFQDGADITFHLWVYSADSLLNTLTLKAQRQYDEPVPNTGGQSDRHYAIALGDFDGDRVRLGPARRFQVSQVIQPMVILNAPPIHFDVFNDTTFDVCRSYNGNPPLFYSRFRKQSSTTVEMTSEVSHAWSVGLALEESSAVFGLGIRKKLTASYGEQYKNISGTSRTVTVQIQVDAREDDRIYATVSDYDIYEYPYYVSDTLMGYIVSLLPLLTENRWFPSKSWSAATYQPDHEVSNIFSYKRYPTLQTNPGIAQFIKGSYGTSFVLDNSSSYDWSLLYQDFITNGASTTRKASVALGLETEVWGFKVGVSGTYDYNSTYTHTMSVTNQLELSFHLDAIDMSIGETRYTVTPYAYWSKNGALVLDYAVRPEVAPPGFPRTWWQARYGDLPDPAFILPWRLDPEKGFPLQENAKRFQTKDIAFSRDNPSIGDTVIISTRIQNYSLVNAPSQVPVSFYLGDPDSGGAQLLDVNGVGTFFSHTALGSREIDTVSMRWRVPSGLPQYPRIYAKLNPANTIAEIHRNNNKAFNVLGGIPFATGVGEVERGSGHVPQEFILHPAYPNPFNPSARIRVTIPSSQLVELKVYDVLGREVRTLVNEVLKAGSYEAIFEAANLASGVYFYRLQAGQFVQTRKLLLLR